ncbi:DUF4097 and DUF4098 domain-containing protein YvlB [Actinoalloteichus hoggarensis]|uniref:DUF4097 domain-containing protein n=1 Tax=Actinoalloteichus hoggarensis TaxID=1470176 RepID=A0A221WBG8_9PSEU|nr:DUF4097 family beta strand repeat-containing protein [Actinoalloteichus hoggarensis]ASO23145.1 hypothetical protein AHOG_27740 [Actinoalloteichus hoggarensis]MBB5922749.1 DUF4097 and DUF4098 domain-containing protein YvlB [Actinoalloteichus hoggarensis]
MPEFSTPEPISVVLELAVGAVLIAASDRADTTVDVRPTDATDESDVRAAQQVRVDHTNGMLRISGPRQRLFDFSRRSSSVIVSLGLPSGSQLSADVQVGDLTGTGRLGGCRFKTSAGDVDVERTGSFRVHTEAGNVTAATVDGDVDVHTGSGRVRVGTVAGTVVVKNSNGGTEIGSATGDVRVRSANGDILVEQASANVEAKTSNGGIRIGEVAQGSVELATAMGDLEIGIAEGTAAWLDVHTGFGQVHNLLDTADRPEQSDETVEIRAKTSFGGVTVRRS